MRVCLRILLLFIVGIVAMSNNSVRASDSCCNCPPPEIIILDAPAEDECFCGSICIEAFVCTECCISSFTVVLNGVIVASSDCDYIVFELDPTDLSPGSNELNITVEDGSGQKASRCIRIEACSTQKCNGWSLKTMPCMATPGGECDVKGEVWLDIDLNQTLNTSIDKPLKGVHLVLTSSTGQTWTTMTASDGSYTFSGLACLGTYTVSALSPNFSFSPTHQAANAGTNSTMSVNAFLATSNP